MCTKSDRTELQNQSSWITDNDANHIKVIAKVSWGLLCASLCFAQISETLVKTHFTDDEIETQGG